MAENNNQQQHHHHHHHHNKRDGASLFKERSLNAIRRNRLIEKWLKVAVFVVACIMAVLVVLAYTIG